MIKTSLTVCQEWQPTRSCKNATSRASHDAIPSHPACSSHRCVGISESGGGVHPHAPFGTNGTHVEFGPRCLSFGRDHSWSELRKHRDVHKTRQAIFRLSGISRRALRNIFIRQTFIFLPAALLQGIQSLPTMYFFPSKRMAPFRFFAGTPFRIIVRNAISDPGGMSGSPSSPGISLRRCYKSGGDVNRLRPKITLHGKRTAKSTISRCVSYDVQAIALEMVVRIERLNCTCAIHSFTTGMCSCSVCMMVRTRYAGRSVC